jgi:hypothetical protein
MEYSPALKRKELKKHGGNLNAYYKVKEVNLKTRYNMTLLDDVPEKAKGIGY